jgi:hypothetical protein
MACFKQTTVVHPARHGFAVGFDLHLVALADAVGRSLGALQKLPGIGLRASDQRVADANTRGDVTPLLLEITREKAVQARAQVVGAFHGPCADLEERILPAGKSRRPIGRLVSGAQGTFAMEP